MFLTQKRNKRDKNEIAVPKVQLVTTGSRPAVNLKDADKGVVNADNGEDLLKGLFPNNPLPPSPVANNFLPVQLLKGLPNNNDNNSNIDTISGDILRLIGSPAALIVDASTTNDQSRIATREWINNSKHSTAMNFFTNNGFNNSEDSINSTVVPNILSFDYCGIACRSNLCVTASNTTKECYIYDLALSDKNIISHGIPPIVYKINNKNAAIVSFTVADTAVQLGNGEFNHKKKKSLIKNNMFSIDKRDMVIGTNGIALIGDSEGNIHFVIFSKVMILQTGMFHAHSAPVVAIVTTG
jgi:hypothetical protein